MANTPAEFLNELLEPLAERILLRRPALGFAWYDDSTLDSRWESEVDDWCRNRGIFFEHAALADLGDAPMQTVFGRHRVSGQNLVSLLITAEDLPDAAFDRPSPVAMINVHRDTLRDEAICLLLWVPRSHARRFLELASNLHDYRTVDLDVPSREFVVTESVDSATAPAIHNLPFASLGNQLQAREQDLIELGRVLCETGRGAITSPISLEGMGGVGKTRLAVEYAWRAMDDYDRIIFLRADNPRAIQTELARLAVEFFQLPWQQEAAALVQSVLNWLQNHSNWLLILDNADSDEVAEFISKRILPSCSSGHVVLTTRFRRWGGTVRAIELNSLKKSDAVTWVLKESIGRRTTADDREDAEHLAEYVGGLPLALEQIVAWLNHYHTSLAEVRESLNSQAKSVLRWYEQGESAYPVSVAAVWEQATADATRAERMLLRKFAFLAPNGVPLFLLGELTDDVSKDENDSLRPRATADQLVHRSILTRNENGGFQLHRLWRHLERNRVSAEQSDTITRSLVRALRDACPRDPGDVRTWSALTLLEPHVRVVLERAEPAGLYDEFITALTGVMSAYGIFYLSAARFDDAELYLERALAIDEATFAENQPIVARDLNNLAALLQNTNRLSEAEPLMRRALEIDEAAFGENHPKVAIRLNNLAQLLQATNRLSEAEPLMRRALEIDRATFGENHPKVARDLNNLAQLLQDTNRLSEAEPLMWRALEIDRAAFGENHPDVAVDLNNLALLLQATDRLSETEPLMRRALAIDEAAFGEDHPKVARGLNNLAQLLKETHRLSEAEPLMRRALKIDEAALGEGHPKVARDLNNLAQLLQATNRPSEAEPLMRRAVGILYASLGGEHPNTQTVAANYWRLLEESGLSEDEIAARLRDAMSGDE